LDSIFLKYYTKIYAEDSLVSESQYPRVVPANLSAEVHTASDALQLAQASSKYVAMGWGLEPCMSKLDNSNGYLAQPSAALMN